MPAVASLRVRGCVRRYGLKISQLRLLTVLDIIQTIRNLCAWRVQPLATAEKRIAALRVRHDTPASAVLLWYQSLDDWPGREPAQWRPQCSVVAELAARHGAQLVKFDGPSYAQWLGQRQDNEAMRAAQAAL